MWDKWVFIAAAAGITCLMRAAFGDIVAAGAVDLTTALFDECCAIAAAQGFPPGEATRKFTRSMLTAPQSTITASMLRDIERGGPIEADHIVGDLLRRSTAQPSPDSSLLRIAYAHLKAYEARRKRENAASETLTRHPYRREIGVRTATRSTTMAIAALSGWTSEQKHVVAASFFGWTLDAFDFFLMVFVLKDIAKEFHTDVTQVTVAILLTLAMRPIGAFLFGRAADRWGRRPTLMVDVLFYSVIEFASGFAPSLTALLILRAIYGIAMGGEWGVGASLTMESIPPHARGFVSGLLQSGYPAGYFLASIVYGLLFQYIGWRGMFMVGVLPALLVFYIRRNVPESPTWTPTTARSNTLAVLKSHWRLGIYAILLMTAFNFFSHGTQDLYPTFLQVQHGFGPHEVGLIAVIYNIGAIIGGISFGALSERFGRRRIIIIAALLSLIVLPLWAFAATAVWLAVGAFLMQVMVQGAWGVIPVHLNELSPDEARGTFPGICLSARQPDRVGQRHAASGHRRALWRQLCLRARGRRRHGAPSPSSSSRRLATKQRAWCSATPGCAQAEAGGAAAPLASSG